MAKYLRAESHVGGVKCYAREVKVAGGKKVKIKSVAASSSSWNRSGFNNWLQRNLVRPGGDDQARGGGLIEEKKYKQAVKLPACPSTRA